MTLGTDGGFAAVYDLDGERAGAGRVTGFRPARQSRLYQDVAGQLREAVLSGQYQPGDRLPLERDLMASFGVSRAVVRQATMNLEHEGLVEVQVGAGGGTFVVRSGVDTVSRAFENLMRHHGVSIDQYLAAKRVLEPALAVAVLSGVEPADLELLEDNLARSRQGVENRIPDHELLRLSLEFHELLVSATSNPVLETLFIALVRMGQRVPAFTSPVRTDWTHIFDEHNELLRVLRAKDLDGFGGLLLAHLDSVNAIYGDPASDSAS